MKSLLRSVAALAVCWVSTLSAEDLQQVYQLAVENDPQLRAARAARDSTFESLSQAKALLLPNFSLSADANRVRSEISGTVTSNTTSTKTGLTLSLSQPVYRRDRLIGVEIADDQVAKAEVDFSAEEQNLITRVAEAYFNVLSAQDTLQFATSENAAIARQLDQSKQRFEVGLIAITAVHEAQAVFDQSRADLIRAENDLDNAWEALREIIKKPVAALSPVAEDLPLNKPSPQDVEKWGEGAQQQNLAIQAAIYSRDIARRGIEVQRSGHFPTLDLVGSHDLDRNSSSAASDSDTTSLGLQLNLPIYSGGGVSSRVRQARFDFENAQENLDKQRRTVNRQVRDAYRGVLSNISTVEALKASTVSAKSALEATEAGFEVGTRTIVDVLNAQRDLFRARSNYSKVRYDYILSGLRLKQAAGTLSPEDVAQVNSWLKQTGKP